MRIVIIGAGFTGVQLAKNLIEEKNQVILIDNDEETIRYASNQLDCTLMCADGNNLTTLEEVGIAKAQALVCVTASDEVNMITCSLVDAVYPDILKIARVRNYAYYVNTTTAEKKHSTDFSKRRRPLYGINYMIHPDVEAAEAIVQAVENGAVGNVISFDNTDLEIARIMVSKGCILDGIALKDIKSKTELKFLVAFIEKDGITSLPTGDSIIESGNTLGILINKSDVSELLTIFGSVQKELNKVALIGAGRIGTIISEKLLEVKEQSKFPNLINSIKKRHKVDFVIIDNDDARAKVISDKFPTARVMCADASDESFIREEKIDTFDLAICVTHNHELNMVLAAYLESLGVGQSISLVSSGAFATIAEKLGVDVAIPLRDCVVDAIMSHLRGRAVKEIHTITNGELEIVECEITSNSKVAGKVLKEISDPGLFLVLINKKVGIEEFQIVNGDTQFFAGDRVVLITRAEDSKKVLSIFTGRD